MWEVTARGTEGRTYVYLVDAPDYAPEDAVWESACRQHGQERRTRRIKETLDLRPDSYSIKLVCPAGEWHRHETILKQAKDKGLTLSASDIEWVAGSPTVDGMAAEEWLSAM